LQNCQSLSVLVSLDIDELDDTFYEYFVHTLSKDLRFVVMDCSWFQDWQNGVHAGRDYWSRAESFISKRRSGEIDGAHAHVTILCQTKSFTCSDGLRGT
jgi:hypothetical protein